MKRLFKLMVLFCLCFSTLSFAKDINVGDLIKLKIKKEITKDSLMKSFEKFEIDKVEEDNENYYISFRIYEAGIYKVDVAGTILNIKVKSLLTENDKDIIMKMENNENLKLSDIKAPFPYEILYLIPITVLGILIIIFIKKRKQKKNKLSPIEEFNKTISELNDDEYYYQLSYALRKYIDKKRGTKLLSGQYDEYEYILSKEAETLIKNLDQQKFNPFASLTEERERTKQKAIDIVNSLETEKGENNGD